MVMSGLQNPGRGFNSRHRLKRDNGFRIVARDRVTTVVTKWSQRVDECRVRTRFMMDSVAPVAG
jgi:hypothetical protein